MKEYFFLFSSGLDVTDLQFAELSKLLRVCSQPPKPHAPIFFVEKLPPRVIHDAFYVQRFSQSCIVYTEDLLNLEDMIRRAGYIHSCGFHIFHNAWGEVELNYLVRRLVSYCQQDRSSYKVKLHTEQEYQDDVESMKNTLVDRSRYFLGFGVRFGVSHHLLSQITDNRHPYQKY